MNDLQRAGEKKKRRRRTHSDWIEALQQTRDARTLRETLPFPKLLRAESETESEDHRQAVDESDQHLQDETHSFEGKYGTNADILPPLNEFDAETLHFQGPEQEYDDREQFNLFSESAGLTSSDETPEVIQEENGDLLPTHNDASQSCAGHQNDENHTAIETEEDQLQSAHALETLQDRRTMWENCHYLSALIAVVGSVRYTVEQYTYTCNVLRDVAPGNMEIWPPYSMLQRGFKSILKHCMPRSKLVYLPRKSRNDSLHADDLSALRPDEVNRAVDIEQSPADMEQVRIFLPTSWAQIDVATPSTFSQMFSRMESEEACLESAQIIRDRPSVTDQSRLLFVDSNGEHTACFPGSEIRLFAHGTAPIESTPFRIIQGENTFCFEAVTVVSWGVGSSITNTISAESILTSEQLTDRDRIIVKSLSQSQSVPSDDACQINGVVPGDICTLLRAKSDSEKDDMVPVLVHRFWRCEIGMPTMTIIWIRVVPGEPSSQNWEVVVSNTHIIQSVDLRRKGNSDHGNSFPRRCGTLQDRTPYVSYRIMLYCDDFRKSSYSSTAGSAGGCYFIPLGLPPEQRRTTSAVRLISLTPPGVSTNEVLSFIVDDIIHGSIHGVEAFNPDGVKVKVFLDLVGFIGDYPAASSVIDVVGHVGRAPCTLCSFRRLIQSETNGSRYGYTTKVHANNSGFLRSAERHQCLRESEVTDRDANILGMKGKLQALVNKGPLMDIHQRLTKERHLVALNNQGFPVVSAQFDPYRCNFVAPDHLLTGLTKDILNTVFLSLPTKDLQLQTDIMICAALRQNGLLTQKEVFNFRSNSINSMTLSELYCVMLVSGPILMIVTSRLPSEINVHEPVRLLRKLHRLISLTYWWPKSHIDGMAAVEFVQNSKTRYLSELKELSKEYVRCVDRFCETSDIGKAKLDKPNLHRLIELYEHSIPAFGHVREFMELIFESAHQPLKRSIAGSNNRNAHIFAMEQCVGNDWQGRIASLGRELRDSDPIKRQRARMGLRRLMLGWEADLLHEEHHKDFITETDHMLERLFTTAVQMYFQRDGLIANFATPKQSVWRTYGKLTDEVLSRTILPSTVSAGKIVDIARRWIEALFPANYDDHGDRQKRSLNLFKGCKRVKITECGRRAGGLSGFDKLYLNCVMQVFLPPGKKEDRILKYENVPGTQPVFFIFVAALHREKDHIWALCLRCSAHGEYMQAIAEFDEDTFQVLCLTEEVTRVAIYHICQDSEQLMSCTINTHSKSVTHSTTPIRGARLYFQRRVNGYPPRVA